MAESWKRFIPLFALVLFVSACAQTSSTPQATQPVVSPTVALISPTAEITAEQPTQAPVETAIPAETLPPTVTTPISGISGMIVFGSNRDSSYSNIYLLNTADGSVSQLTKNESNTFPGPFSPDGKKLLFTGYGLTNSYVGLMNADGSDPVDLSARPDVDEGFASWSPDGKQIVFTSRMDGNNDIYIMDANGGNIKRLTTNPTDDFAPAWSPDGKTIAFVSDRNNPTGVNNLYLMNADGSNVVRLTLGDEIDYSPTWSPDGQEIAFQTNRDGNWEIYVMNADGSNPTNLTHNPSDDQMPFWKPAPSGTD